MSRNQHGESHIGNDNNNDEVVELHDAAAAFAEEEEDEEEEDDDDDDEEEDDDNEEDDDVDDDVRIEESEDYCRDRGDGLIQQNMHRGKPSDTILDLIESFPMEVQHKNSLEQYPLHTASANMDNRYEDVAMKLIDLFPIAAQHKDHEGRYPLHLAIIYRSSEELLMKLIEVSPDAVKGTTLHLACQHMQPHTIVAKLIEMYPQAIQEKDNNGNFPLHYACYYPQESHVETLLHHPDIDVNATNVFNDTPLHATFKSFAFNTADARSVYDVRKLLEHPFVLINEKNNDNKTPLDLIKDRLAYLEKRKDQWTIEEERSMPIFVEILHILEEFPVKQRYKAYCYHVNTFMDL